MERGCSGRGKEQKKVFQSLCPSQLGWEGFLLLAQHGYKNPCSWHGLVVLPQSASETGSRWQWEWELWAGGVRAAPRMWRVICVLQNSGLNWSSRAPCAQLLPLRAWRVFPGTPKPSHFLWEWDLSPQLSHRGPSPHGPPTCRAAGSICIRD